ncbi:hypothetical protein MKZ38_010772 [Zalerion maritima]|uniref:GPI anchored serine-rich protein n=1 Tax=Zalerion maritima TaxID=339359 RepID=A0AAD5WVS8_9PEZI|nr:hypothetical protein MKZ38_010772 [Zalerion maritima]
MRFAAVAAFFAGAVMAQGGSTVYQTEVETITSCGPTVSDCPAATATEVPVESETEVAPVETTLSSVPVFNNGSAPYPTEEACGGVSVKTISTSVTTVIPTVIYETVDVPCETATATGTGVVYPTGGWASSSEAVPSSTETPVFTGGASSMGVSLAAAAAGIVALLA